MKKILTSFILYFILVVAVVFSFYEIWQIQGEKFMQTEDYSQPALKEGNPWSIKSVDTQVVSKHWPNVPKGSIKEQVVLIKDLGVNYIAIATPYDRLEELKNWVDEIHLQGLNVWFRSHWAEWEGTDGKQASLTPQQYLDKTVEFIKSNPDLFREGDAFTVTVEPEQAGVGLGKKFLNWDQYRRFILDQILYSNEAFGSIGLKKKIYTNWISVNGWVVENVYTEDMVDKLGLIVIDHYTEQSKTVGEIDPPEKIVDDMSRDLDRFYTKWHKPILLGEWGYQIYQNTSEENQAFVVRSVLEKLQTKPYLIGVNYWVHMGNQSRLIGDEYGANLKYRQAALMVKEIFSNNLSTTKTSDLFNKK